MKARTVYGYRVCTLALSRTFDCEIENWKPFDPLSVSHNITLRSRSTHVNSLNMLHASYGATNRTPRIHFTCMGFTITYGTAKHWCHTYGASKRCVSFDQYFSLLRQNTRQGSQAPAQLLQDERATVHEFSQIVRDGVERKRAQKRQQRR